MTEDFEKSISLYYAGQKDAASKCCVRVIMSGDAELYTQALSNLKFYPPMLAGETHDLSHREGMFQSSSCCILAHPYLPSCYLLNQRMVNYSLEDGDTKLNYWSNVCMSQNRRVELSPDLTPMSSIMLHQIPNRRDVQGVEDLRLYMHDGKLLYTGATKHTNGEVGVVTGEYDLMLRPNEMKTECMEKNWVYVPYKGELCMIYSWHPLKLIRGGKDNIVAEIDTPPYLRHARGSTNACAFGDELWFIVHFVNPDEKPRQYYHAFVVMDHSLNVLRCSCPFKFEDVPVQFCLGLVVERDRVLTSYSTHDGSSKVRVSRKSEVNRMFESDAVIVSAYFPLPNFVHRSQEEYLKLGHRLINVPTRKLIFAPQSVIDVLPTNAHTEYVCVELAEVEAMWPDFELPKVRNMGKDTDLFLKVILTKTLFLSRAAKKLGMDRRYIWMDMALPRFYDDFGTAALDVVHSAFDRIRMPYQWPLEQYQEDSDHVQWFTLGGLVAGIGTDLCWFHEQARIELLRRERLVWEVNVWAAVMHAHPDRFSLYRAGFDSGILYSF